MNTTEMREIKVTYCDGCGREMGYEIIYGYGTDVEIGTCCYDTLREFESHMYRVKHAVNQIKAQPFF